MKLITFFLTCFTAMFLATPGQAAVQRMFQDIKLPTQAMMEHYSWASPAANSATLLFTNHAPNATVTSFSAQPDVCRNIVITPTGTTGNVQGNTIVVNGTNIKGAAISENFVTTAASSSAVTGSKAFCSITSIVIPADGSGVTYNAGSGTKLGLPHCADVAGDLVFSIFNSAYETTRGTLAANASAVESNTFIPNGSPDGSKKVEVFFVQNFRCQ